MSAARRIVPDAPARRGWCPSLARPMPTGDGLLARVHPPLGLLTVAQARAVAQAARLYGNGHIDVTARANLQIRGVTEDTRAALAVCLAAAGLGDVRADGGPQRLTLTTPLAGLTADPLLDIPALARAIETSGLGIAGLPAKTLVAIEAGRAAQPLPPLRGRMHAEQAGEGAISPDTALPSPDFAYGPSSPAGGGGTSVRHLTIVWEPVVPPPSEADIRLAPTAPGTLALTLAGDEGPIWLAGIGEAEAPALVACALDALAASGRRRMRDLAPEARAHLVERLGLSAAPAPALAAAPQPGLVALRDGLTALILDAPFGRCDADALDALAEWADRLGGEAIRLSPSRGFALIATDAAAARGACEALAAIGFIVSPEDPRGGVAACPGAPACASGSTPTLADAGRLAEAFRGFAARGLRAHVSGCAKGCAHPGAADLTLVGRDGRYDVVLAGRPDAVPATRLTFEAVLERVRRADPLRTLDHAFRTPA